MVQCLSLNLACIKMANQITLLKDALLRLKDALLRFVLSAQKLGVPKHYDLVQKCIWLYLNTLSL